MSSGSESLTGRRVHILAYPAPTTGRYLVFVLALLTSGMFVGNWLHNEMAGEAWIRNVMACDAAAGTAGAGGTPQEPWPTVPEFLQACKAPYEQGRAVWSLGGAAAVGAGGLLLMYLAPVVVRRRRRLTSPGPTLQPAVHRFDELCTESGARRAPAMALGSTGQLDAFSFGTPGRYSVVLPKAVAIRFRDPTVFDAVVRHELAHVHHRDVAFSWLARSIWYFLGPVLLIPVFWSLVEQDLSLLGSYLWRAALLAAAVELTAAGLLRAREFEADLWAARGAANLMYMRACLQRLPNAEPRRGIRRRALARHPLPARRQEILEAPWLAAQIGFTDAVTAAFLAALSMPLIIGALIPLLTGTGLTVLAGVSAALLTGPLLGSSVGLGLWRSAAMARAAAAASPLTQQEETRLRRSSSVPVVAAGVALGLLLGQTASLAQTGISVASQGIELWAPLILGAGAVGISAAMGEVWADALALVKRPAYGWGVALATNCLLFTTAAWLWDSLWALLNGPGWSVARLWLAANLGALPLLAAIVLLVACTAAGLFLRSRATGREPPHWLFEDAPSEGTSWAQTTPAASGPGTGAAIIGGLIAGALVAGIPPVWRLIDGPAPTTEAAQQRVTAIVWMCAAAWGAFMLAAILSRARAGPAAAVLGGFVATGTGAAGFLIYNLMNSGTLNAALLNAVMPPAVGLGFVLALAAGSLTAFTAPLRNGHAPGSNLPFHAFTGAATVLAGIATAGLAPVLVGSASDVQNVVGASTLTELAEVEDYANKLVPRYLDAYDHALKEQRTAQAMYPTDPLGGVDQLRDKAVPALAKLRTELESLNPRSQKLRAVHADLLEAVRTVEQEYLLEATAVESLDPATISTFFSVRAVELQAKESLHLTRWGEGLTALRHSLRNPQNATLE